MKPIKKHELLFLGLLIPYAFMFAQTNKNTLIQDQETRFKSIRQLTFGGENAEAYFSSDGKRLVLIHWTGKEIDNNNDNNNNDKNHNDNNNNDNDNNDNNDNDKFGLKFKWSQK